jgi:glycosyltransferase involved in cell wall biosynthesis
MHIGVDALFRFQGGGEVHLRKLLQSWRLGSHGHRITVYTLEQNAPVLKQYESDCLQIRGFRMPDRHFILKLIWEQTAFARELQRDQVDIVLGVGGMIPLFCHLPRVLVLRNAGPFCESINLKSAGWKFYARFRLLGFTMRLAARHASHVIFISHYFRKLFTERFGLCVEQTSIVYHGYDDARPSFKSTRQPDGNYFIYVSYMIPYKNVREVIQGFMLMLSRVPDDTWKLLVVGGPRDRAYADSIYEYVNSHEVLKKRVILTGDLPHDEVSALLSNASAFVFASTCENCPNSLIEAMAYGLPIANSTVGVMPEITGEAAIYFDPYQPEEIANALSAISKDIALRQQLAEKSRQRIRDFKTWPQVAEQTLVILANVFGRAHEKAHSHRKAGN